MFVFFIVMCSNQIYTHLLHKLHNKNANIYHIYFKMFHTGNKYRYSCKDVTVVSLNRMGNRPSSSCDLGAISHVYWTSLKQGSVLSVLLPCRNQLNVFCYHLTNSQAKYYKKRTIYADFSFVELMIFKNRYVQ